MNYESVFECNPSANEIYVVDGMPFLEPGQAQSHANSTGKPMQVVKRSALAKGEPDALDPKTKEPKAPKELKAPKEPKVPKAPKATKEPQ